MDANHAPYLQELSRRLNSLGQGGLPVDIGNAVAYLSHPASEGVMDRLSGCADRICSDAKPSLWALLCYLYLHVSPTSLRKDVLNATTQPGRPNFPLVGSANSPCTSAASIFFRFPENASPKFMTELADFMRTFDHLLVRSFSRRLRVGNSGNTAGKKTLN